MDERMSDQEFEDFVMEHGAAAGIRVITEEMHEDTGEICAEIHEMCTDIKVSIKRTVLVALGVGMGGAAIIWAVAALAAR